MKFHAALLVALSVLLLSSPVSSALPPMRAVPHEVAPEVRGVGAPTSSMGAGRIHITKPAVVEAPRVEIPVEMSAVHPFALKASTPADVVASFAAEIVPERRVSSEVRFKSRFEALAPENVMASKSEPAVTAEVNKALKEISDYTAAFRKTQLQQMDAMRAEARKGGYDQPKRTLTQAERNQLDAQIGEAVSKLDSTTMATTMPMFNEYRRLEEPYRKDNGGYGPSPAQRLKERAQMKLLMNEKGAIWDRQVLAKSLITNILTFEFNKKINGATATHNEAELDEASLDNASSDSIRERFANSRKRPTVSVKVTVEL